MISTEKPRILLKSKNIQIVLDYCFEQKLEFTVIPRENNDEWEVEISIKSIVKAIELGMFMKSNKLDLVGSELFPKPLAPKPIRKAPEKPATPLFNEKSTDEVEEVKSNEVNEAKHEKPIEQQGLNLSF